MIKAGQSRGTPAPGSESCPLVKWKSRSGVGSKRVSPSKARRICSLDGQYTRRGRVLATTPTKCPPEKQSAKEDRKIYVFSTNCSMPSRSEQCAANPHLSRPIRTHRDSLLNLCTLTPPATNTARASGIRRVAAVLTTKGLPPPRAHPSSRPRRPTAPRSARGRVDLGACPPRPPTDPDVHVNASGSSSYDFATAIRCCFVNTVTGLGVPVMFPSNGS